MRTFLCVSVPKQTSFVLVQFLLPWNLLSQLPHYSHVQACSNASSVSQVWWNPNNPFSPCMPVSSHPNRRQEPFPATVLVQQQCMRGRNGGMAPAGAQPLVQVLSHSDVQSGGWLTRTMWGLSWVPDECFHTQTHRRPPREFTSSRLGHCLGRTFAASKLTRAGTWIKSSLFHMDIPKVSVSTGCLCSR